MVDQGVRTLEISHKKMRPITGILIKGDVAI